MPILILSVDQLVQAEAELFQSVAGRIQLQAKELIRSELGKLHGQAYQYVPGSLPDSQGVLLIIQNLQISSDDSDRNPVELLKEDLHSVYPIRRKYNAFTPVYEDPLNSNNFILLNLINCETWARAIVSYILSVW